MCSGGSGLVTFHWVKGLDEPYPDFNTWHTCQNPDSMLHWALENAIPVAPSIERTPGIVELEDAPY